MKSLLQTISVSPLHSPPSYVKLLPRLEWKVESESHINSMNNLLYPQHKNDNNIKSRSHAVSEHPIYNFLHNYYRYSVLELKLYSPGIGYGLEDVQSTDLCNLHRHMIQFDNTQTYSLLPTIDLEPNKRYGVSAVTRTRDILDLTCKRSPHFACFGLHEWAMLYSNNDPTTRHQSKLKLRVSQSTIDNTVEQTPLSCTHFDAWRFFQPSAQPLNALNPLSRSSQLEHEQPGCIHATMDLFRYAYELYPFTSSSLLRTCLEIAVIARKIDMRASPYDVSEVEGCEDSICIETAEGKIQYIHEQEALYRLSYPVRTELLEVYNTYLSCLEKPSDYYKNINNDIT